MTRILVDINVLLDFLTGRTGFDTAKEILNLIESNKVQGVLCAHELPTLAYFLEREHEKPASIKTILSRFCELFEIVDLTGPLIREALQGPLDDFEDGLVAAAAHKSKCRVILTRNAKDFRLSPIPPQNPKDFLAAFKPT